MNLEQNVAEFKRLEVEAEQAEANVEEARWAQARLATEAVEGGASLRGYADQVGKSDHHIGRLVRVWRKFGSANGRSHAPTFTDAYRMAYTGTDDIEASKEVDRLRKRLPAAPDKRAEFLAEQLQADKTVAKEAVRQVLAKPSAASRAVQAAVSESESARRARAAEQAKRKAEREALPLPAHMATMVVKMNEWALGLDGLHDELDTLPDGPGLDSVERAAQHLEQAAGRWVETLARRKQPELRVIEGQATRTGS